MVGAPDPNLGVWGGEGEDPDIAGIVPGPQPPREDQLTDDEDLTPET